KNEVVDKKFGDYSLGERVVLFLTESEWGKQKIIHFNNFFSFVKLLQKFKMEQTLACDTIRTNIVGNPKHIIDDKKLLRGEYDWRVSNTDVTYFKWKDNRIIHLASNFHGHEKGVVQRKNQKGNTIEIRTPKAVQDYNCFMGSLIVSRKNGGIFWIH
ncbi:hypothetical protein ILUMI_11603, partial [Ignelater luminosus]